MKTLEQLKRRSRRSCYGMNLTLDAMSSRYDKALDKAYEFMCGVENALDYCNTRRQALSQLKCAEVALASICPRLRELTEYFEDVQRNGNTLIASTRLYVDKRFPKK